jgi:hypothetical protein
MRAGGMNKRENDCVHVLFVHRIPLTATRHLICSGRRVSFVKRVEVGRLAYLDVLRTRPSTMFKIVNSV